MKIRYLRIQKYIAVVMLLFIFCCIPVTVHADEDALSTEKKPISVFFPLQHGFAEINQDGSFGGYNYDYLMHIAQLTGWEYDFRVYDPTNETLTNGLEMVRTGQIDLAGTISYSEELAKSYEYSLPYGKASFALVANSDNEELNARTIASYDGLRIATVLTATNQNAIVSNYCTENNIDYELVYAKNNGECRQLLLDGLADVMVSKDIARNVQLKVVAKFNPAPFYFVAQKGNRELINQLNDALRSIDASEAGHSEKLHEKYFPLHPGASLPLTMDEREYIENAPSIRVAVLGGRAPIQDYNEKTGEFSGILIDILSEISSQTGLELDMIYVKSGQDLAQGLDTDSYDVVAGISYYYNANGGDKYSLLLTAPVFKSPIIRISNLRGIARNPGVIVSRSIKKLSGVENALVLERNDEIFKLVNSGEYGEAYINGHMAQYAAASGKYPNVSLAVTYDSYELCLGVTRENDLRLVNILTQSIAALDKSELEGIVYRNTNYKVDNSFMTLLRRNPAQVAIPALFLLFAVAGLLLLLFTRTKRLNKLITLEKNQYMSISQIDKLSKAYNNVSFKHIVLDFLSSHTAKPCGALMVCDIDNFKQVNDSYGHLQGDYVISKLGDALSDIFDGVGVVGRLGGDEFVILLKNITDSKAIEQYCIAVKNECLSIIAEQPITLSIGAAVFSQRVDFDELFKLADKALYAVKGGGKDSFKIIMPDGNARG